MPTFPYRCIACGHEFDQFQKFSDDPLKTCPVCELEVRRVIGNVGVVFKGSGWYITDSRKSSESSVKPEKNGKADAKEPTAATKSDAKTESKSDTKSETKSDSK